MKRVLMTGDTVGGVWTFTLELAEALGTRGIEVVLAAMGGPPNEAQRREAHRISNLWLLESNFKLEWMEDPWDDVGRAGEWLLKVEESVAPQVVHLNTLCHGALNWSAPVVLTGHSCVLSWWRAVKNEPAPPRWDRYRAEVAGSLQRADVVTAPTRAMLSSLKENYGPLPRSRVVLNGRNPAAFRRGPKEDVILCAGRLWDEGKNVRILEQIAADLPWPVYVAGETRGAVSGCRCLDRLPSAALADWYARATIYALPARYEPFGLSALEAALSGCALVLGDIPSLREVWQDAAFYVPPDDAQAWVETLRALARNKLMRSELARRSSEHARLLTPARMADEYLMAYYDAAGAWKVLCA